MDALREAISVVGLQLFNLSFKRSGEEVRQRVTHHSETTGTKTGVFNFLVPVEMWYIAVAARLIGGGISEY